MSHLEELVIESAEPSSLGAKVFQPFIMQADHKIDIGETPASKEWCAPLCPSLKRFGLKYHRWVRRSEHFSLIPRGPRVHYHVKGMFNLRASKLQHMDDKQSSAPVGIDEESRISWAGSQPSQPTLMGGALTVPPGSLGALVTDINSSCLHPVAVAKPNRAGP